ncbi:hypothetical protein KTG57_15850, partial [Bacteroides fragilis]|uniref:hypothetical protein n=1 Tax=Bacteroides fragilis TaxID=817 RepID=UPI001C213709
VRSYIKADLLLFSKFRENLITFGQTNLINKSAWFRKEQEKNDIHTVTSNNYAYEVEKTNPLQTLFRKQNKIRNPKTNYQINV